MAYTKTTWATDDVITADLLNKLEDGVEEAHNQENGITPVVSIEATVDSSTGTPNVEVTKSGTDAAPEYAVAFTGIKGAVGDEGAKGIEGDAGTDGKDGVYVTAIEVLLSAVDKSIVSWTFTYSDTSTETITVSSTTDDPYENSRVGTARVDTATVV